MSATTLLLVGTKKGLFIFTSKDRRKWSATGPFQPGREINHAVFDPRTGRVFATANDSWFGCEIVSSPDLGATWESATLNPKFAESSGLKLERIWHIEPARAAETGVLYAGVAPAALFRSEDNGKNWTEVTTLSAHPTRVHWHPGAGGLCLHSIVIDHAQAKRMFTGISAVGVFRTEDGGASWETANRGTRAGFQPDQLPEYGQCVHKLLMTGGNNPILYQQNHCGVYRSADGGRSWEEITTGLPSEFGFPLALHPRRADTLYVIPLQGAEFRCPPERKLRVFRSRDSGKTWTALNRGLPDGEFFGGIYREGMASDAQEPAGIYFGTNNGKVFNSDDEGESWRLLADNLPPVFSVATGQIT
jgi:photosystem II stability/assembly factor-like uncharacterized protein